MKHCTIHPIPLWVSPSDKSHMTYFANFGQPLCVTGYVWYIEGAGEKILVDSGGDPGHLAKIGIAAHNLQSLESGLDKAGIAAEDIDLIIQTHLHFDHTAFASRFPNARVMVQKRELDFARNPHPVWAGLYDPKLFNNLKFEVVDGDFKISQDINILFTPGHSPGGQSVSVKTDQGTAVIAGLCSILDNYNPPPLPDGKKIPAIAPAIHSDLLQAYDSVVRIKELADIILPIHDPSFLTRSLIP
jgi:N-acyl homoserine lactone hydrolase